MPGKKSPKKRPQSARSPRIVREPEYYKERLCVTPLIVALLVDDNKW